MTAVAKAAAKTAVTAGLRAQPVEGRLAPEIILSLLRRVCPVREHPAVLKLEQVDPVQADRVPAQALPVRAHLARPAHPVPVVLVLVVPVLALPGPEVLRVPRPA